MMTRTLSTTMLITLLMGVFFSGCYYNGDYQSGDRIEGEGPLRKMNLDLEKIHGIIIKNSADVYLKQGNIQKVEVEAQENIIRNLDTSVTNGVWSIRNIRPVWRMQHMNVYITIPDFRLLRISGSGNIRTENYFENLEDVELLISGSGDADLDIECDQIYAKISGSGSIRLKGNGEKADFTISGSGDIRAAEFEIEEARAMISGSGGMKIKVKDELDARISGSGNIEYIGKPRINARTSGSGDIYSR